MRFLKEPTKAWKKVFNAGKMTPESCPDRTQCFPCGLILGSNEAGFCAGLMPWREDLDVVSLCVISEDIASEIHCDQFTLCPDEAIEIIRALSKALDECFALHEPYLKLKRQNRVIFQQRRRRHMEKKDNRSETNVG